MLDPKRMLSRLFLRATAAFIIKFGIAVVLFSFCGCGNRSVAQEESDYELEGQSFDQSHLRLVEEKSGVKLPPNAEGLQFFWKGHAIDPSFVAKIRVKPESVEALIDQLKRLPNKTISVSGPPSASMAWWYRKKGEIKAERTFVRDASYVHVILSAEETGPILYIEWIST